MTGRDFMFSAIHFTHSQHCTYRGGSLKVVKVPALFITYRNTTYQDFASFLPPIHTPSPSSFIIQHFINQKLMPTHHSPSPSIPNHCIQTSKLYIVCGLVKTTIFQCCIHIIFVVEEANGNNLHSRWHKPSVPT